MVAFIKRRKDFKTVASSEVVSYDVPLASIADDVGTILLYDTAVTRGNEGDFLIMDGHIWLIDQVTPMKGKASPLALFWHSSLLTITGMSVI